MEAKPGFVNASRSAALTTATPSTIEPRIAEERFRSSVSVRMVRSNRAAVAGLKSADYFFTASVVFHGAGFGFGVGQHAAIGRDDGDTGAAFGGVGDPTVQHGNLVGGLRRKGRYGKRMNVDQADQRLKFVVSVIFVAGAEGALGQKVHGQQGAREERQEGEREFPKKFTPHVSRTDNPHRGRSSGAGDFPDRIQFFRAAGGRTRPRSGA